MADPTITCPTCKAEIKLTESLAAPLIEATRREYEKRLAKKDSDMATREAALAEAQETLDQRVAEKLKMERAKIASEESKKAKLALATELEEKDKEIEDLNGVLKVRDGKLAEAQKAQAELIRKQRELDDAKREMDLTIEKRV
jgi:hypothetical protein